MASRNKRGLVGIQSGGPDVESQWPPAFYQHKRPRRLKQRCRRIFQESRSANISAIRQVILTVASLILQNKLQMGLGFIREIWQFLFNLNANGVSDAWPVLPRPLFKSVLSISG